MKTLSPPTPFGYTIFCDDIRAEGNGKLLFIGVYFGKMYVRQFPYAQQQLIMRVNYFERPGESTDPVQIRVYTPGSSPDSPIAQLDIPADFRASIPMPEIDEPIDGWEKAEMLLTGSFNIAIPLVLEKPGLIRVRAQRGDLSIKLGSLAVELMPQDFGAPPPS